MSAQITNKEITKLLREIAASYAIKDDKKYKFQIIAYQKAADSIEHATIELRQLWQEGKLGTVPGLGSSLQQHLDSLFKTGNVEHFENIKKDVPQAVFPLLEIPGFGPKTAAKLVTILGLTKADTVIDDLEKEAMAGKIASIDGFGEKSQQEVIQAIKEYRGGTVKSARMVLPRAFELSEQIISYLKECKFVEQIYPLGSLRRMVSTIGDVDLAVASTKPQEVIDFFTKYPYVERIIEKGPATASILVGGGKHVDLMVQPPSAFGSLLQHFTGGKNHNIHLREYALKKGLSLSEYGIKTLADKDAKFKGYSDEKEFYKALGLQWVPPEMREDTGEIELAIKKELPELIEITDIKGDFHLHSSYPIEPSHDMGVSSMEVMVKKAQSLGYKYMGFSEHNPSVSKHTKAQIYDILKGRMDKIEQINKSNKSIRVFSLLETDILVNGNLAIDDKAFDYLDGSIVSIHSSFSMDRDKMTERVLKGLSHPKAKILAHPTGRLLNERTGYELDWKRIFEFCLTNNKALEINSWPERLDLPDGLVRQAIAAGVKLIINTDSHEVSQMDLMKVGVAVARRGWATKDDIINTWEQDKVEEWFNK